MTDRDLLEIVAEQVAKLTNNMDRLTNEVSDIKADLGSVKTDLGNVKADLGSVKTDLGNVKADLGSVKATVIRIEHDHGKKLGALFDGYAQVLEQQTKMSETLADHTVRLERIEEKLAAHDIRITVLDKTKAEKRKAR